MRVVRRLLLAGLLAGMAGCQTTTPVALIEPTPIILPVGDTADCDANPVFVPPVSYGKVWETILQVLGDYQFEISEANRYAGQIEMVPRVSPGVFQLWRPGSPDLGDRVLATMQTYRHRVSVVVQPAQNDGYFVEVIARKELEDLPRPIRATAGAAIFRAEPNVERQFEVIDPTFFEPLWVYKGRDAALEQELIRRIKKCL